LSIYVTSWRSAELLDDSRDKIVKAVRADVEEIFGRLADPDWIRVYPRSEAMVLPEPLHFRRMQAFQRRRRQRVLYAGDWLTGSTIEGAVRTGLAAAERILGTDQGVGS
jgi:predicted NAD/FAD-dependent oxidoreductase